MRDSTVCFLVRNQPVSAILLPLRYIELLFFLYTGLGNLKQASVEIVASILGCEYLGDVVEGIVFQRVETDGYLAQVTRDSLTVPQT